MKSKQNYVAPRSEAIKMAPGSFLCASGETESFTSGNSYGDSIFD